MSFQRKTDVLLFLFLSLLSLRHVLLPVASGHRVRDSGRLVKRLVQRASLRRSHWREPAASAGHKLPLFPVPPPEPELTNVSSSDLSWSAGQLRSAVRPLEPGHGHQADFTGFHGVPGKVLGPALDSGPHSSDWLDMRPLVLCEENEMSFSVSGQGLTHLLVDREASSPISPDQLPPYCGFTVKTSLSDLHMMVPYDACYITLENDSYVLPMLWWDSPVKLSCPMELTPLAPSAPPSVPPPAPSAPPSVPAVFCSPYGMAVQLQTQGQDLPKLGVTVNGDWGPFVSEECADLVHSRPDELTFFISYHVSCFTHEEEPRLHFVVENQEYVLSCPVGPPDSPDLPDPVSPASSPRPPQPPQTPTQEQVPQLPHEPYHPYPGFQYQQVYLPGPQHVQPTRQSLDSPPGFLQPKQQQQQQQQQHHQQQQQQQQHQMHQLYLQQQQQQQHQQQQHQQHQHQQQQSSLHTMWLHNLLPLQGKPPPVPPSLSELDQTKLDHILSPQEDPLLSNVVIEPPPFPFGLYYPSEPIFSPTATPAAAAGTSPCTQSHQQPEDLFYPHFYVQVPHHPPPTAPAETPPTLSPPPPPKQPQYPVHSFYPPSSSKYPHRPEPGPEVEPPSPHFHYPHVQHFYHTPYDPLNPLMPKYPEIPPSVTTPVTTSVTTAAPANITKCAITPSEPTPPDTHPPQHQCLTGRMVVFMPFADLNSIQVKDEGQKWRPLSTVSPDCRYLLQMAAGGVFLHSPLPACHSHPRTSTNISLPLKFLDLSTAQYHTLEPQCPHERPSETPHVSPAPPSTTFSSTAPPSTTFSAQPEPPVVCSSRQMSVQLPSGPISGIILKDTKGNLMSLQDTPKHCGYSATKGKDGQIHLSLDLHSRCQMSVEGQMYIISVVYGTKTETQEAHFSCPVVATAPGKDCSLPSKHRLPCGPAFVTQPQCLSIGCCYSHHAPACYYPMDECTIDHHFVFSVPASITDPPLAPSLLVAASNSTCKPQRVTSNYALFKLPMDGCGTRRVVVGKMVIYMVEVISSMKGFSVHHGTITRDSPVRFLVECRFHPDSVLTVSYLVKTPTFGPGLVTKGIMGVQLRIAKDAQYSSFYPQYHQPLQMLLGKPLHLEVSLMNSPDPGLVLLVHFCVAYPRSGQSLWVLLYNGCPNPLDPPPHQVVLSDRRPSPSGHQTRQFTISTFQFLPNGQLKNPSEEIYFMCSTEACSPLDGPCVEGCFSH